ncbi:MAG: short-chain dehydrogenase [Caulobacter sp.]|nr:short-chain dehydrogenase [Caulobacter sp.]
MVPDIPPGADAPFLPPGTLAGQVALVTGGGSGLGLAMALAFARAGADIAVLGRSAERCADGVAQIAALGVRAIACPADVRDEAQVALAFDRAEAELGPVSILANNAGGNFGVLSETMSARAWRAVTQIALDGTLFCSAEFARRRIAAGGGGVIVNNAANYVWTGFPGDAHSSSAKAAVVALSEALAREWAPHGIRVNSIAMGFFPHSASPGGMEPEKLAARGRQLPVGRVALMHEAGWAAALLCSPMTATVAGQCLLLDGGHMNAFRGVADPEFIPPRQRERIL